MVQQLTRVGKQVFSVVGKQRKQASLILRRTYQVWFTRNSHILGGLHQRHAEPPNLIDQPQRKRLLTSPDLPGGQWFDGLLRGLPTGSNVMHELAVHVIDQRLKVSFFLRRQIAAR